MVNATSQAEQTVVLAVLRGALLDVLATGDVERTTVAVHHQLTALRATARVRSTSRGEATLLLVRSGAGVRRRRTAVRGVPTGC